MTLEELKTALAAHPYPSHFTATNVLAVRTEGTDVVVGIDTSALETALADARWELAEAEKEAADDYLRAEKAEKELAELKRDLAQLRDPDSGVTVADFRRRTEEAEKRAEADRANAREWHKRDQEREHELVALRKRKGVIAGYVAHRADVMRCLALLMNLTDPGRTHNATEVAAIGKEARDVWAKLQSQ